MFLCVCGLAPVRASAQAAQEATFAYARAQVAGGFVDPRGIAVDASGNVYVVDSHGAGNSSALYKETLNGDGSYTQALIDSSLVQPEFLAIDNGGVLYVGESTNPGSVVMETPSGGAYTHTTIASTPGQVIGVAVGLNGVVYAADTTDSVYELSPSASGYSETVLVSGLQNISGLAYSSPALYVATSNDGVVTSYTFTGSGTGSSIVASGLSYPEGVAVDTSGFVYVAEAQGPQAVVKISQGSSTQTDIASGSGSLYGVAVDASGNIYYSDQTSRTVQKLAIPSVNFFTQNVGTTSAVQSLSFDVFSGVVGSVSVVTQGASGLDFAGAGGTCASGMPAGSGGSSCTVNVSFTPTAPGTRYGAVNLFDTSGTLMATAYLYGVGLGPQLTFSPGTQINVTSAFFSAGVAVDGADTLYITDQSNDAVVKITTAGGRFAGTVVVNTAGSPTGVAVDGSGAVYVTVDTAHALLKEIPRPDGTYQQVAINSNLPMPLGVAVDGSGNVYVTDEAENVLYKESVPSGVCCTLTNIAGGFNGPGGVAVDASGDVFVADSGNNRVVKETPTATGLYTETVVASGLNNPSGVAVDGLGNVYIADMLNGRILEETPSGTGYTQSLVPVSGAIVPASVAVDAHGNLYINDCVDDTCQNPRVFELDMADPPSFNFGSAPVGTSNSGTTQTVTLQNFGTTGLTFSVPGTGNNPGLDSPNFTLLSTSTCPQVGSGTSALTFGGSSCTEVIAFTPQQVGALSGSLVVTDNNLNRQSAQQSVALTGTGTPGTPVINPGVGPIPYGSANASFNATISYGGAIPTGQVTFTVDNLAPLVATCAQVDPRACSVPDTYTALSAGTHSLTVIEAADANYAQATATGTLTITPITPTVTVAALASLPYGTAATSTLTAQIAYSGPAAPTGAVHFTINNGSGSVSSVLASCGLPAASVITCTAAYNTSALLVGSHTVTANISADTDYNTASGTGTLTVTAPAAYEAPTCTLGTAVATPTPYTVNVSPACTEPQGLPITATINWGVGQPVSISLPVPSGSVTSPVYQPGTGTSSYTVTLTATDAAGLVGTASEQITIQPPASVSGGSTSQISTTVPNQNAGLTEPVQIQFVCSGVSGVVNGASIPNTLPSQYGITCTSPVVTIQPGAATVPVNVTVMTNSSATLASVHGVSRKIEPTALALVLPIPAFLSLMLGMCTRRTRRRSALQLVSAMLLIGFCFGLNSCSSGFTPPPAVITPKATYNLVITEQVVTVPAPTSFVQTSLIVPLKVN